jgi:hypothetical protein
LRIEVEDTGRGAHAKTAENMEQLRQEKLSAGFNKYKGLRGRGLFMIISNLVDTLYFKNTQTRGLIVGVEKKISLV